MRVFTVPPDCGFLSSLVRAVLAGGFPDAGRPPPDVRELASWTFLVPTRRAVRLLEEAFLDACGGALLLPVVRPLGDTEQDLFEDAVWPEAVDVPRAISPMGRDFLLLGLIRRWAEEHPGDAMATGIAGSPPHLLALARSLGDLADRFTTGEVAFDALALLTGKELSHHREALLGLLDVLQRGLPQALGSRGLLSPADRRNRLLDLAAGRLARQPPAAPVIVAGSTGTVPASARFIITVAGLAAGAVVLPGLDRAMDETSWSVLGDTHPQAGMKRLLALAGLARADIPDLPHLRRSAEGRARAWIASETLRPADATDGWHIVLRDPPPGVTDALRSLTVLEARSEEEEAAAIALLLRDRLETAGATAALVTPNRRLARKVQSALARWGIAADDSAGDPLIRAPEAQLALMLARIAAEGLDPLRASGLIHHPLVCAGLEPGPARSGAQQFEIAVLRRGFGLAQGFAPAATAAEAALVGDRYAHATARRLTAEAWAAIHTFAGGLDQALAAGLADAAPRSAADWGGTVTGAVLALAGETALDTPAGLALAELLSELGAAAEVEGPISATAYATFLETYLATSPLRAAEGSPRLAIFGLLEARLVETDLLVLGGLNAGSWPGEPDPGPWLNRPMREALGLQQPERQIGLAAHDFAQGLAKPGSVLTLCRRAGPEPLLASRFVIRLRALAEAAGVALGQAPWLSWVAALDWTGPPRPVPMPEPSPPPEARPRRFSVSDVGRLMRDPYALYAERILRLAPLDPLRAEPDARLRGALIHAALARHITESAARRAEDPLAHLLAIGRAVFAPYAGNPEIDAFWWPRFERIARWFIAADAGLRGTATVSHCEIDGHLDLAIAGRDYRLTARADRIDLDAGGARIIDYKGGSEILKKDVLSGLAPQLPLEAAILMMGGFRGIAAARVRGLLYMHLTGRDPPGRIVPALRDADPEAAAREALSGLRQLLARYAEPDQPYRPGASEEHDRIGPYDQLARRSEWSEAGSAGA